MTQEQEAKLEQVIKDKFEEVRINSLRTGARMICGVVLEIAHRDKPYNQRINEIIEFCNTTLGKAKVDDAGSGE